MTHVALFRNLNLGHKGCPTKDMLLSAFGSATVVRNFQTNGTILFTASDPKVVARQAIQALRLQGFDHWMVIREIGQIETAISANPPSDASEGIYRSMVSFFDVVTLPKIRLPLRSNDALVELRRIDEGSASSVCWKPRNKAGDVTGFLESLIDARVTTRTIGTLERLVAAHKQHF